MDVKSAIRSSHQTALAAAILASLSLTAGPVFADDKRTSEINSIVTSLKPIEGSGKSSPRAEEINAIINGKKTKVVVDYGRAIDLTVYFRYNSAAITKKARGQLDAVGKALASPKLQPFRYLVAGHTDARGSAAYNRKLSTRRAISVRKYLVEKFGIRPNRLIVAGWGESRLKNPDQPRSGVNRRVEVALIADEAVSKATSDTTKGGDDAVSKVVGDTGTETVSGKSGTAKPADGTGCPTGTKPVDPSDGGTDIDDVKSVLTGSEPRCVAIKTE